MIRNYNFAFAGFLIQNVMTRYLLIFAFNTNLKVESTRREQTSTRRSFSKNLQYFLYPEHDPDLSQNLITSCFGQELE